MDRIFTFMEFEAILENFNTRLWSYHLKVPGVVVLHFKEKGVKRLVCRLNTSLEFQCAIMPAGDGVFFINLNKKIRDSLKLKEGGRVHVELNEDTSEYGLPIPDELKEVLIQDEEGHRLFHALTPGKQRNLIYIAGQVKNSDLRIQKSMVMLEHLKKNGGKINFRELNEELKTTT